MQEGVADQSVCVCLTYVTGYSQMNTFWKLILLVLMSVLGTAAYADIYQYEGADGVMVLTDDPSNIPRKPGKVKTIQNFEGSKQQTKREAAPTSPSLKPALIRKEDPEVQRGNAFYDIGGYTFMDVRREIYYRSPKRMSNQVAVAWCRWEISWVINTIQDDTLCRINSIDTRIDLSITMPRWVNYASAGNGMKEAWDTYYKSVLKHEETHGNNGVAAARDIQHRLYDLTGRYSCKDLQEDGKHLAHKIIKEYRQKDEEFDRASLNTDMITDVEIAADQREGVLGRQYPEQKNARPR
jgi:predicted secreted Zn-dependent protease